MIQIYELNETEIQGFNSTNENNIANLFIKWGVRCSYFNAAD